MDHDWRCTSYWTWWFSIAKTSGFSIAFEYIFVFIATHQKILKSLTRRENGGHVGMVPLVINPIYTLCNGIDCVYPILKGTKGIIIPMTDLVNERLNRLPFAQKWLCFAYSTLRSVAHRSKMMQRRFLGDTWRITPVSKWLVTSIYKPWRSATWKGSHVAPVSGRSNDHHGY